MTDTPYNNNFYGNRNLSLDSAEVIIPIIMDLINPSTVIDVGCGTGEFLRVFKDNGVGVRGLEGGWIRGKELAISQDTIQTTDFEQIMGWEERYDQGVYDLAVSLEVAEHISPESAESFVEFLTDLSSVVLFSAAIPLQGGVHHVNEQWIHYWIGLFDEYDYVPIDCVRGRIWNNPRVAVWYKQNIMLYVKRRVLETNKSLMQVYLRSRGNIYSIIHPDLYLLKTKKITLTKLVGKAIKHLKNEK